MIDDGESQQTSDPEERARTLYWGELVQLKHAAQYVQHYRDRISTILTRFEVGRAIVSGGALGSWVGGVGYPKLWGAIIVASQVGEAVMAKLPLPARQRSLSAFGSALDAMLIDALLEWEDIQDDEAGSPREITRRWHILMKRRHEAEQKNLPSGLPFKKRLFRLAEQETATYFESNYRTRRTT